MCISKKLCSNFYNLYHHKYCCCILKIYTTSWSQNKTGMSTVLVFHSVRDAKQLMCSNRFYLPHELSTRANRLNAQESKGNNRHNRSCDIYVEWLIHWYREMRLPSIIQSFSANSNTTTWKLLLKYYAYYLFSFNNF